MFYYTEDIAVVVGIRGLPVWDVEMLRGRRWRFRGAVGSVI